MFTRQVFFKECCLLQEKIQNETDTSTFFSLQGCLADVNNWIVTIINKTEKIAVIKIQLCPQYMQGSTNDIEALTI